MIILSIINKYYAIRTFLIYTIELNYELFLNSTGQYFCGAIKSILYHFQTVPFEKQQ